MSKGWKRLEQMAKEFKVGTPFNPIAEYVDYPIRWILWRTRRITFHQKNILQELYMYVNLRVLRPWLQFPSLETIADDHTIAQGYASDLVNDLERQGFIRIIRSSKGGHATPEYEILWHDLFVEGSKIPRNRKNPGF